MGSSAINLSLQILGLLSLGYNACGECTGIMQVKLIYNRLQFNLTVLLYIVTLLCKKNRAPKCYAGLLQIAS